MVGLVQTGPIKERWSHPALFDGLIMLLTIWELRRTHQKEYIMTKKNEGRTMQVVLDEIKTKVDKYNLEKDAAKRNILEVETKNLVAEYNDMALLDAYATFKAEANPLVALAKAYTYMTVGAKATPHQEMIDGVKKSIVTMVLTTDKPKMLNVAKFIEWMNERNVSVTARVDWKKRSSDAHSVLKDQWKSFIEEGTDFKVGILKTALQDMVDSLIMLEGEKGGNSYTVSSKITRSVIAFCTSRKDGLKGVIAAKNTWEKLQMDILHAVVTRKEFEITYGELEDNAEEASAEESAE